VRIAATAVLAAIAFGGCAATGGVEADAGSGGTADGVPAGATKEQYLEAFKDVDPIELFAQTPAPKGAASGLNTENYLARIEEWSGGKITFDIAYANAVATATEIDDALNDGRLDVGSVLMYYEPSDYPATNALIDAGILNDGSAIVGVLQSNAWANEVAFNTPEIMAEWDKHGLVPLIPVWSGGANGLFCTDERDSLDEMQGTAVAATGTIQNQQVEALGAAPVSIVYTEFFESVQRGVVDCIIANGAAALLGGVVPAAPHAVFDSDVTFAVVAGGLAFSKSRWDTLPLVAQQLIWDSMSVYFEENITVKAWPNLAGVATEVAANGGSFRSLDGKARAALVEANKAVLDDLRGSSALDGEALIDDATAAAEKWAGAVAELGFDLEVDYGTFAEWWDGSVDISQYTDTVMTDVFGPQRPE
jgi:TRAP-type C4-dicarboxylate transport system substrate-binding protein